MYCDACGEILAEGTRFCGQCGAPQTGAVVLSSATSATSTPTTARQPPWAVIAVVVVVLLLALWLVSMFSSPMSPYPFGGLVAGFSLIFFLMGLVATVIFLVANWKIATKAGYQGVLSLLMLIPVVNLVIYLMFAFGEWPIERDLRELRARVGK